MAKCESRINVSNRPRRVINVQFGHLARPYPRRGRKSKLSAAVVEMLSLRPPPTTFSRPLRWPRRGRLGGAAAAQYVSAAAPSAALESAAPPESVSFPILVRIPLAASNVLQTCSMKRCYGDYWLSVFRARLPALVCAMVPT